MTNRNKSLVILSYNHVELFPPALSAIFSVSNDFELIVVVTRHNAVSKWEYPANVKLEYTGSFETIKEQEKSSFQQKLASFASFFRVSWFNIAKNKPSFILAYDPITLMVASLVKLFTRRDITLWYHSHDVAAENNLRVFSIGWFTVKLEPFFFQLVDIFTLPSAERLKYYAVDKLKGSFKILPNYPSLRQYSAFAPRRLADSNKLKLIYQGTVSEGHGLELIVQLVGEKIGDRIIELHLAGNASPAYISTLKMGVKANAQQFFHYHGVLPYQELPNLTYSCDVGIAINEPRDVIYQTGGTASNKIYEYMACGLPILYFNDEHYKQYLSPYKWAYPVDLAPQSIVWALTEIIQNYEEHSLDAKTTFEQYLNYENLFVSIKLLDHYGSNN